MPDKLTENTLLSPKAFSQSFVPLSTPLIHFTSSVAPSIFSVPEDAAYAHEPVGVYRPPSQLSPTTYGATPN